MRIATWNVNSVRQRLEHLLGYLDAYRARRPVPAGAQMHRRGLSAGRDRGDLGYRCPRAWPEGLQRRRAPDASGEAGRDAPGLPGDEADVAGALHRGAWCPHGRSAVRVASIYLPNGNPVRHRQIPLQARLHGPADRRMPNASSANRGARGAGRRLQCDPGGGRRRRPRELAPGRALPAGDPGANSAC